MKKNIGGVPQQIRRLTVSVYERAVETAIGRGLLGRNDTRPWTVTQRGYLRSDQRGQGEAIIAAVNALIWRQR